MGLLIQKNFVIEIEAPNANTQCEHHDCGITKHRNIKYFSPAENENNYIVGAGLAPPAM
jgi:hypothetical protein